MIAHLKNESRVAMRLYSSVFFASLVAVLALLTSACGAKQARSNRPAVAAPAADAQRLSAKAFDAVKSKAVLDEDSRLDAYIICVADEVIREMHGDWEIAIFQKRTPFVYVLPGRKIGINNGITQVARNQHQLAALIAHGVAHVKSGHLDKRVAETLASQSIADPMRAVQRPGSPEGQSLLRALAIDAEGTSAMAFDAAQESEANVMGLELMARAGFNPRESVTVWRNVEASPAARSNGLAAVHPSYGTRSSEFEMHMDHAVQLQQQALATRKKPDCDRVRQ